MCSKLYDNNIAGGVFRDLMPKEEFFSRALYTFDIGQNDLTSGYFLNMTTPQVKAYIPDVLHQLSILIKVSTSPIFLLYIDARLLCKVTKKIIKIKKACLVFNWNHKLSQYAYLAGHVWTWSKVLLGPQHRPLRLSSVRPWASANRTWWSGQGWLCQALQQGRSVFQ